MLNKEALYVEMASVSSSHMYKRIFSVMVFAVVERAGTIVMNDKEELDSWSVIINGEVRIDRIDHETGAKMKKILKCGDAFGIEPTMEKLYHQGVMKTVQDDCQFVCITQVEICPGTKAKNTLSAL